MKKNFLLVLFLVVVSQLSAQLTVLPVESEITLSVLGVDNDFDENNIYFKDVNNILDKYVGEWEYVDGSHNLKIKIELLENRLRGDFPNRPPVETTYDDHLVIRYQYKENGVEIYNNLQGGGDAMNMNYVEGTNITSFNYREPTNLCHRIQSALLRITFVEGNVTQGISDSLDWERFHIAASLRNGICHDGTEADNSSFRIPEEMTLARL